MQREPLGAQEHRDQLGQLGHQGEPEQLEKRAQRDQRDRPARPDQLEKVSPELWVKLDKPGKQVQLGKRAQRDQQVKQDPRVPEEILGEQDRLVLQVQRATLEQPAQPV